MSGRRLRPDERALWDDVARSATPLARRRHDHPEKPAKTPAVGPRAVPSPIAPFQITGRPDASGVHIQSVPGVAESLRGAPVRMDFKTYKRMARGKMAPEARIDLHGMTIARAQPTLAGFILSSHGRGLRLVLVITGKGRPDTCVGPMPQRLGILRHEVPMWLSRPPLASLVQQVSPANPRHGGHGAYYVYLRRS